MIIWILWEDQRDSAGRSFGPHDLLISCLCDDQEGKFSRWFLNQRVRPNPRKGDGKVLNVLKTQLLRLGDEGAVCAVFDRDKAHRMWGQEKQPARCRTALLQKIKNDAPGAYEVVFLEQNVETLLQACAQVLGLAAPAAKSIKGRDQMLQRVAYHPSCEIRMQVRKEVPSFDRLVRKVSILTEQLLWRA